MPVRFLEAAVSPTKVMRSEIEMHISKEHDSGWLQVRK